MEHIHKWYESNHALDDVDFKVYPGEVVIIVGDNGAGKSTLANILAGVVPLSKGKIKYKGKEVEIKSVKDSRKLGIEAVYQNQALIGIFSVSRNIFLGREIVKGYGPIKILDVPTMRKKSEMLTKALKLKIQSMDQEARFCSGGEAQGITMARALYFKSELVILDEPTTALSVEGVKAVIGFVRELKEAGIACIIVTHRIDQVYPIADRFVYLIRGKKLGEIYKKDTTVEEVERFLTKAPSLSGD